MALTRSEEILLYQKGYTFLNQLGEGSYAKVYLTVYKKPLLPEKVLACKVINTKKAPRDFVTKFLPRELDILLKLNHPHVIHVYCIFQKGPKFLTFMRYAEKGDLLDYILKNGEIPERQSKSWFYQLSLAVEYLHAINVAHRDIKCENILITKNYNVKLADFGFSRFVVDQSGRETPSTTYCGSLAYASPEILRAKPYHPKGSDVWSMGVVLYIMLNKSLPFHDGNAKLLYRQQMQRSWKFRSRVEPYLSDEVKRLLEHLLEPDIRKRSTIGAVVKDIWFAMETDLRMTEEERSALETGYRIRDVLPPNRKSSKGKGTDRRGLLELGIENEEDFESQEAEVSTAGTQPAVEEGAVGGQPPPNKQPTQAEVFQAGPPPGTARPKEGTNPTGGSQMREEEKVKIFSYFKAESRPKNSNEKYKISTTPIVREAA